MRRGRGRTWGHWRRSWSRLRRSRTAARLEEPAVRRPVRGGQGPGHRRGVPAPLTTRGEPSQEGPLLKAERDSKRTGTGVFARTPTPRTRIAAVRASGLIPRAEALLGSMSNARHFQPSSASLSRAFLSQAADRPIRSRSACSCTSDSPNVRSPSSTLPVSHHRRPTAPCDRASRRPRRIVTGQDLAGACRLAWGRGTAG